MKIKDIIKALQKLEQEKELKFLYDYYITYDFDIDDCEQQEKDNHEDSCASWNKGDYLIKIG